MRFDPNNVERFDPARGVIGGMIENVWDASLENIFFPLSLNSDQTVTITLDIFAPENQNRMLSVLEIVALCPEITFKASTAYTKRALELLFGVTKIDPAGVWGDTVEKWTTGMLNWYMRHPEFPLERYEVDGFPLARLIEKRNNVPYTWPLINLHVIGETQV